MITVLAIDDDAAILTTLRTALRAHDYAVVTAPDGRTALQVGARVQPDVIVLDLGLPDVDGVTLIERLRVLSGAAIIVISGRQQTAEKIHALDAGADDYVTKPFPIDELLARIRAAVRRDRSELREPVVIGRYLVDVRNHVISSVPGSPVDAPTEVHLTPTEWSLLELLVSRPGQLVSQRHLLDVIRGPDARTGTAYLRQYMTQIRHKLEPDPARPRFLLTELGMGYRFRPGH
jgi:two-component system, OmpR family, KDP operon response regulator KdpE